MVDGCIFERRFYEQHPPYTGYILTDKDRKLAPVLKALYAWGGEFSDISDAT